MKNSRGQMTVEVVLMTAVVVMVSLLVMRGFRDNEIFSSLVSGPWKQLSGMIQNGVWSTPQSSMVVHPNSFSRVSSVKGEVIDNE